MDAIVCDTSSLIRLFKCDSLPLLALGFDRVLISRAVLDECNAALRAAISALSFVTIENDMDVIQKYGLGERAMLNVALALKISTVLTDDEKAIHEATRHALTTYSAIDILVLAKKLGADISIRVAVSKMTEKNERIEESALLRALNAVGEP